MIAEQQMKNNYFHDCGTLVILKEEEFLEIILPYCPVCKLFLDFEQYPHLVHHRRLIPHSEKEQTLILENMPFIVRTNHNCHHLNKTLLQYHEGQKMRVWQCNDCQQIIRERD